MAGWSYLAQNRPKKGSLTAEGGALVETYIGLRLTELLAVETRCLVEAKEVTAGRGSSSLELNRR